MRTKAARWGVLVGLLFLLAPTAGADDVPEAARKKYAEARALYLKGDAKSLASAFSALSEAKGKAPDSADFWELFVRVWRASKKPEADLWGKIIAPREQAAPKSPVFDIVRARVETDQAKKGEFLQKAIEKDPASVPTRLLLVQHLRATGEEIKAEDLLDKVLEQRPDDAEALVMKTQMMVDSGLSRSAVKFATEALEKRDCPALRYALALALQKVAAEEPEMRPKALEAAKKAVEGNPDPAYVATLADILDESDRTAEAVALLKTHVEKGNDPRLAGRLGALAFRAGDYDAAVRSLALSAPGDRRSAKALALAHARRGRAKEARAALDQAVALDAEAAPFAGSVELLLGDPAAARRRIQGRTDDECKRLLTRVAALEGKFADVFAAVGTDAASGSREGEDGLLLLVVARLHNRMGAKSLALRKQFVDARAQVAQAVLPEAKVANVRIDLTVKNGGYMERAVTYLRSACGTPFKPEGAEPIISMDSDGMHIGWGISASADCARDSVRKVRFNAKVAKKGESISLDGPGESPEWTAVETAFAAGCAALVAEDAAKAVEQFAKVVEGEPEWARAKLLHALAQAFVAGSDMPTVARAALDAVANSADDWEAREAAITLGASAGVDVADPLKSLQKHVEERAVRRFDRL